MLLGTVPLLISSCLKTSHKLVRFAARCLDRSSSKLSYPEETHFYPLSLISLAPLTEGNLNIISTSEVLESKTHLMSMEKKIKSHSRFLTSDHTK